MTSAVLAAPFVGSSSRAQGAAVTLKLHHYMPPLAYLHTRFLAPWARGIEADSGGRLRIELYPSMQLGGTAPQLYDQLREGRADLIWTMAGFTPDRFPRIEVLELPFVAHRRASQNGRAAQELFETRLADEFKDVQPLCVWATDGAALHINKPVKTLEDLRGLRIRAPTRLAADALKALGAHPVTMPLPQLPDALAQKAVEGCLLSWETVPAFKLQERVRHHVEIAGPTTLSTTTYLLAMNKARYAGLPADLRQVLDKRSGQAAAQLAARMWDEVAAAAEDAARKQGNTITVVESAEAERWRRATQPVTETWLKQAKARGFNGQALLADARAVLAKYGS